VTPLVVGHQGSSEGVPPASLEAYEAALAAGAEMVEMDVRRTPEGRLLVLHDALEAYGDERLRAAAAVEDVAALVARAGRRLLVDVKDVGGETDPLDAVLRILEPEQVVVSSFEDASVARLRRERPQVPAGLSIGREWRRPYVRTRLSELFPAARAAACGASFLSVNHRLVPTGVLRRSPLPLYVWTVDSDRALRRHLRDERLLGVITNRPRRALELRARPVDAG
jgi:glycerophosphoryl diester phosphodiesterase